MYALIKEGDTSADIKVPCIETYVEFPKFKIIQDAEETFTYRLLPIMSNGHMEIHYKSFNDFSAFYDDDPDAYFNQLPQFLRRVRVQYTVIDYVEETQEKYFREKEQLLEELSKTKDKETFDSLTDKIKREYSVPNEEIVKMMKESEKFVQ